MAAHAASNDTGIAVVTVLDEQSSSDSALFILDLPADPASRGHIVDRLRQAAAGRLDGVTGYLAYALVEDTHGARTTFAVIEPIMPGPGNDRRL